MEWLVGEEGAGIIPASALLAVFGAPGAGKSFVAADLACHLASRRTNANPIWFGNSIKRGPVLYVVAEGQNGFRKRILAWMQHHQMRDEEMAIGFVESAVNLHGPDDVSHILRTADLLSEPPSLVVFDTLARCMVGGDDNSSTDVGIVIANADKVRTATGASVLFVHHAKKDGDVERGSSALRAGVDTLMLARDDEESGRVLACEKQKDADPFDPITFYLKAVGDSSVVTDEEPRDLKFLTPNQRKLLSALDLFTSGATSTEWLRASGVPDRSFYRVRQGLLTKRYVTESERSRFFLQADGQNRHLLTLRRMTTATYCHVLPPPKPRRSLGVWGA
jgi:RecA/RadA recombinase